MYQLCHKQSRIAYYNIIMLDDIMDVFYLGKGSV